MDRHGTIERTRQEIIRLCHAGLDSQTLRVETIKQLCKVIPIDVSFFATADPATLLFTGAIVDDLLASAAPQFLANEFLHEDVVKFARLARSTSPVGYLGEATRNQLERSARYRDILAPLALGDELRAALRLGSTCWGFMCLHRERASPHFTATEAAFLRQLTPHLAEGLRAALLIGKATELPVQEGPGLILLADDLALAAMTPTAERWLAEIDEGGWLPRNELPQAIYAVAARLLALEQESNVSANLLPRVRLRTKSGQWLVLHASRLRESSPFRESMSHGYIAVIMEVAQPVEIAPLIVQAYNLSRRESEITQSVARGLSTAEIAAKLHISPTTVQDHCKAIFDKVGVHSRRELVGVIFAQQYQPRMMAGYSVNSNGWFDEATGPG
jgi:DNA-binding CsgD family transcriptional regulator